MHDKMVEPHSDLDVPNLPALAVTFSMQRNDGGIEPRPELALPDCLPYQLAGACHHNLYQPAIQHMRAELANLVIHLRQSCTHCVRPHKAHNIGCSSPSEAQR